MPVLEPPPPGRRFLVEWLFLLGALLVLAGNIAFSQYQDYQQIDTQERERLAAQAKVIDDNLGQQLRATSQALDAVRDDLGFLKEQPDSQALINRRLKAMSDAMVGVRTLLVLDAQGTAVASDRAQLIGQNFAYREYFKRARDTHDPTLLQVSLPFTGLLGVASISLVKSIVNADGAFTGIVTATLDPEYFNVLLGSIRYASDMRATIVHADGVLFLMSPNRDGVIGKNVAKPGSFFSRYRDSGQSATVMTGISEVTGQESLMAQRTIKPANLAIDKPLLVAVSREVNSIFADWRRATYRQAALFTMLACMASSGLFFYQRRQRVFMLLSQRQEAQRQQAELALQESEAYNKLLFAQSHIPLAVIDPTTGRLVDCNQAIIDIYGLGTREAVLATVPTDVAPALQYDGRGTTEAACEYIEEALRTGSCAFEWLHQRPNGQLWDAEVRLTSFQHGDKTLVQFSLEDITARRRAQDELRIAATAFEAQEGLIITDAHLRILRINRACSAITGYSLEEAVGRKPSMFSSGRHDTAFYRDMWDSITKSGSWTGELWNRRKCGEVYPQWASISAVKGEGGQVTHYVASFTDISQRKSAENEIQHLAFYDPLTQLPNRRLMLDRLRHALVASTRSESSGALFFIDIDNFKALNDTLGHDKGDLLLASIARRLRALVREEDTVARLGGDEFVIMMEGLSLNAVFAATQAKLVGRKVLDAFIEPHDLDGASYSCSASVGIALFLRQTDTVEDLLKQADLAMFQAKAAGRGTLRFFDPQMQSVALERAALEVDLREGLRKHQLLLHYQPQVDDGGRVTGAEALVRWQHPQRGMIPPLEFIPLAEEIGLILPLGQWVLETACAQLSAWSARPEMAHFTVAVNVSAHQLRQRDFVAQVLDVIKRSGANPRRLKLELTESLLVENVEDVIEKMFALKAKGVGFSLDDFGTGYSSLSYLKRLPLDQLKIDQSFVRDIHVDANDAVIAKTIVALAHSLGLGVIAEGVETAAQRDFLAEAGCHAHQGYFFSRPLAIEAFEVFALRA